MLLNLTFIELKKRKEQNRLLQMLPGLDLNIGPARILLVVGLEVLDAAVGVAVGVPEVGRYGSL